jgi:CNT family concentrative nucleoside transporter
MERFSGVLGIILILALAFLLSNNRKAINYRLVFSGLGLQLVLALFILKTAVGQNVFSWIGHSIEKLLQMADKGGEFVFGGLIKPELLKPIFGDQYSFLFMFKIMPTIIFVAVLVNVYATPFVSPVTVRVETFTPVATNPPGLDTIR